MQVGEIDAGGAVVAGESDGGQPLIMRGLRDARPLRCLLAGCCQVLAMGEGDLRGLVGGHALERRERHRVGENILLLERQTNRARQSDLVFL